VTSGVLISYIFFIVATPVAAAMDCSSSESFEEIQINGIDDLQRVLLDKFGIDVDEITRNLGPKIDMFTETGYLKKPEVYKEDYEWVLEWMTENGLPPEAYAFYQDMCMDTWTHLYYTWQNESTSAFKINKFDPEFKSDISKILNSMDPDNNLSIALKADVDMFNYVARQSRFLTGESLSNMVWSGNGLEDYKQSCEDLKNAINGYDTARAELGEIVNSTDQQRAIGVPRQDYFIGYPLNCRPEGTWSPEYYWAQSDADALFKTIDGYLSCATEYNIERLDLLRLSTSGEYAARMGYTAAGLSGACVAGAIGIAGWGYATTGWTGVGAAFTSGGSIAALSAAGFFSGVASVYLGKLNSIQQEQIKLVDRINTGLRPTSEAYRIITTRTVIRNEWTVPSNCYDTYLTCFKMELPKPVQGVNEKS
jgi:hypothetical protein